MVILYRVQCKIFLDLCWHCLDEFTTKCILLEFTVYLFLYPTVTIRDNDLLLQLLEEFPHLHISPRTLNKMWHQQLAQTEHLKAPSARPRPKLQNEVSVLILPCWMSAEMPWQGTCTPSAVWKDVLGAWLNRDVQIYINRFNFSSATWV